MEEKLIDEMQKTLDDLMDHKTILSLQINRVEDRKIRIALQKFEDVLYDIIFNIDSFVDQITKGD